MTNSSSVPARRASHDPGAGDTAPGLTFTCAAPASARARRAASGRRWPGAPDGIVATVANMATALDRATLIDAEPGYLVLARC